MHFSSSGRRKRRTNLRWAGRTTFTSSGRFSRGSPTAPFRFLRADRHAIISLKNITAMHARITQKTFGHWHSHEKNRLRNMAKEKKSSANKVPIERGKQCFLVHLSASQFKTKKTRRTRCHVGLRSVWGSGLGGTRTLNQRLKRALLYH